MTPVCQAGKQNRTVYLFFRHIIVWWISKYRLWTFCEAVKLNYCSKGLHLL